MGVNMGSSETRKQMRYLDLLYFKNTPIPRKSSHFIIQCIMLKPILVKKNLITLAILCTGSDGCQNRQKHKNWICLSQF